MTELHNRDNAIKKRKLGEQLLFLFCNYSMSKESLIISKCADMENFCQEEKAS